MSSKLKMNIKGACMAGASAIFAAQNRTEAIRRFNAWKTEWQVLAESAVRCLEKDLHECLTYLDFEPEAWKKIRTTNVIERTFREVRRRTRPMSSFTNPDSCDRIVFGVVSHLNRSWERKPLKEFTQNT